MDKVNFIGGLEATVYYTSDLDDAVGTAGAMAERSTTALLATETRRHENEIHA